MTAYQQSVATLAILESYTNAVCAKIGSFVVESIGYAYVYDPASSAAAANLTFPQGTIPSVIVPFDNPPTGRLLLALSATDPLPLTGGTVTGLIQAPGGITNLPPPTNPSDAATLQSVNFQASNNPFGGGAVVGGFTLPGSVTVIAASADTSTAALPAYTYAAGVITMTATGVVTVDGHALALNDLVFNADLTTGNLPYNGIYKVTTAGAVGVAAVLTRATLASTIGELEWCSAFATAGTSLVNYTAKINVGAITTIGTDPLPVILINNSSGVAAEAITRAAADAAIIATANATLSQSLTLPGGLDAEVFIDPNGYIGGLKYGAGGAVIEPTARLDWRTTTNVAGSSDYILLTLMNFDTVVVDGNGYIAFGVYTDGTVIGNLNGQGPAAQTSTANLARLRRWRNKIGALRNGYTPQIQHIAIGDSWTDGNYWLQALRVKLLSGTYGNGNIGGIGPGWCGFSSQQASGPYYGHGSADLSITVARDANWTDQFTPALGTIGTPQPFPDLCTCSSSVANAQITVLGIVNLAAAYLYYLAGAGAISYSWNGGATWTALSLASGSGPMAVALPVVGAPTELIIQQTSGTVTLSGIDLQVAGTGLRVHKLAVSGSEAAQWASVNAAQWEAITANLGGDAATILLGLNDAKDNTQTVALTTGYIQTIVTRLRAAFPGIDILIIAQPDTYLNVAYNMSDLATSLFTMAETNDCGFLNLQQYFGPISTPVTYSDYDYGSANPYLDVTHRHPSTGAPQTGQQIIVDAVYRALMNSAD